MNPRIPIAIKAKIIFNFLNISVFPFSWVKICENSPKPGKIKMYTSGWPKNQNICWYIIGSPLPKGLKNDLFILWSNKIIVIALVKIGKDRINKIVVIRRDHIKSVILLYINLLRLEFKIVDIKLIDLRIDDKPFKWREKIIKLIEILLLIERGG